MQSTLENMSKSRAAMVTAVTNFVNNIGGVDKDESLEEAKVNLSRDAFTHQKELDNNNWKKYKLKTKEFQHKKDFWEHTKMQTMLDSLKADYEEVFQKLENVSEKINAFHQVC